MHNYYNQQQYQQYYQQYYPVQYTHAPTHYYPVQYTQAPTQENFIIDVKNINTPETQQSVSITNRYCKLNMSCKDVNCNFFHHPGLNNLEKK
jgi:hypothetical protein